MTCAPPGHAVIRSPQGRTLLTPNRPAAFVKAWGAPRGDSQGSQDPRSAPTPERLSGSHGPLAPSLL